jgi:hypothetical protein
MATVYALAEGRTPAPGDDYPGVGPRPQKH